MCGSSNCRGVIGGKARLNGQQKDGNGNGKSPRVGQGSVAGSSGTAGGGNGNGKQKHNSRKAKKAEKQLAVSLWHDFLAHVTGLLLFVNGSVLVKRAVCISSVTHLFEP